MKEKTILVVGGAGYIGSHMVKELLAVGHAVIVLDNFSTGHRALLSGGRLIEGDLGDPKLLETLFSRHKIDAVMHFAAFSLVGESVVDPLKYYRNNLAGTMALLGAMIQFNVKKFIFSSTAAVYGEPVQLPITETHPSRPTNPYGATKIAVERMLADCDQAHGLKSVCLRYFNAAGADESGTIGECHQPESHLIPLVLKVAAGERKEIKIFGTNYATPDGTCIRDYVHVTDLAQAHLLALNHLLSGGQSAVYNLGNSKGASVREVICLAEKITGRKIPVVETNRRAGDPAVLVAASSKIKTELDWHPRYETLETIIQTAWNWHKKESGTEG
jgi:UDP-glucose 4-epimerase